ncbi:MAG TPA: hypothetical protein VJH92_03030 [Candidatus Nanoarchaeia archaeon]|nr:hypothetical protein [Candidatus Nanoarchaeia archaeon]
MIDNRFEINLRVGVVGYCPPSIFDEGKALDYIKGAYNQIRKDFPYRGITIVAGVTNVGVLKLAYEEAKRRGWRTAGVGSKKAYGFEWFPVDEKPIIVGEDWGDESETFLSMIDALVRIGGDKQSKEETDVMKKIGAYVLEYDLPLLD